MMTVSRQACLLAFGALAACNGPADPAASTTPEASASAQTSPAPANAEEDVRHFLLQEYPDAGAMQYALAWSDLDGDGANEAIVHIVSPMLCGTGGCNTLVLAPAGPMWRKVGDISVSRTPITVLDSETRGWKDLTVDIGGGGGAAGTALLKFDGKAYPENPTVSPAELTGTKGTELIPEEPKLNELAPVAKSGG